MNTDPILDSIAITIRRILIFIFISMSASLLVWFWTLTSALNVPTHELVDLLRDGWNPSDNKMPFVLMWGSLAIGVLFTCSLYLTIAHWWKKRRNVRHHRGARWQEEDE